MLTIGEFSKISRVSTKTLRYYDQIGLLKPGHVSRESGYRYYEVSQLRDMLLISRLKEYQFSLPEIAAIMAKRDDTYLAGMIRAKKEELLSVLDRQQRLLIRMEQDIMKIERCENIMQTNYLIQTVNFKPVSIYSIRQKMSVKDFSEVFGRLCAGFGADHVVPAGPFLSIYHDEDFNLECADIEVGIVVQGGTSERVRTLDPGLCCFLTHIGPYDDFNPCYTALMEWIEREGYEVSGAPFELYIRGMDDVAKPENFVTEIYMPIKK